MTTKPRKTCLIISYGPVPTPEYNTVEGGGMRAWGLATGLTAAGISVTVGINTAFPQAIESHEGINLVNWEKDKRFVELINSFDSVLVSYCMGDDSVFIADHILPSVQLILDAYVPIYIEISARESEEIDMEYRNYMKDIVHFNKALRRGDYFLCASDIQKTFYTGVLSALGIINTHTYRQDRVSVIPFGVDKTAPVNANNPYKKLGAKPDDFIVLWFGGLYPWFRVEELLDAVLELSKNKRIRFYFVGTKNPFNPNMDFFKQHDLAMSFAQNHNLLDKSMFFVEWVDFDERFSWFKHADVTISLNQPGQENALSWRTRVMDFVGGELAIITNGGDALSDQLIANGAALKLDELSSRSIIKVLEQVQKSPTELADLHKEIKRFKEGCYWENLVQPVASLIEGGKTPYFDELTYKKAQHIRSADPSGSPSSGIRRKTIRAIEKPKRIVSYARRKGIKRSALLAASIAKSQLKSRARGSSRQYVFIGNNMDNSGAPLVLCQIAKEYADVHGKGTVQLVSPIVAPHIARDLRRSGIVLTKAAQALGWRLIRAQIGLHKEDFVLLNTIAVYKNYLDFIFHELEVGKLEHAYWFIHEDPAQIKLIDPDLARRPNLARIKKLVNKGRLTILTPSNRSARDYDKVFDVTSVKSIPLLVSVPKKYCAIKQASDFQKINFCIVGYAADGRKGQLLALAALNDFLMRYQQKNPGDYRDFSLSLVSIENDNVSKQIKWIGAPLGKRVKIYPAVPQAELFEIMSRCNSVICCSLNETFALYVAEAMTMGQVVLRNDSGGMEEQLKDGINGYFIDHRDIHQFADTIEKILNKKTPDQQLAEMAQASQSIIREFSKSSYLKKIENLEKESKIEEFG